MRSTVSPSHRPDRHGLRHVIRLRALSPSCSMAWSTSVTHDGFPSRPASAQAGPSPRWSTTRTVHSHGRPSSDVNYALSPNLDLGLRYKYFIDREPPLPRRHGGQLVCPGGEACSPRSTRQPTCPPCHTDRDCDVFTDASVKFRTHSLVYADVQLRVRGRSRRRLRLRRPPPPPPPATQTCPDGSVILATDVCPAPPPPPPPPPPAPERG